MKRLEEGWTYNFIFTVTNSSTKDGSPCEAPLDVAWAAHTPSVTLLSPERFTYVFGPGEKKTWNKPVTIPYGHQGEQGNVILRVYDPDGKVLAQHIVDFEITWKYWG